MPRGAPSWRGASADAPGSGDPGPPGLIVRAVRRDPDNASSRRVTPLVARGRKETGHPRARPKGGASMALATPLRERNWVNSRAVVPHEDWIDGATTAPRLTLPWRGRVASEASGVG